MVASMRPSSVTTIIQFRRRQARRVRSRGRFPGIAGLAVIAAALATVGWYLMLPPGGLPDRMAVAAIPASEHVQRPFTICGRGARVDCVVDGDTFYAGAEKIRIADMNAPEITSPLCAEEKALGEKAKRRLHALLNSGLVEIRPARGRTHDRYGRLLKTVHVRGRSVADTLAAEGLAHEWRGRKESWCG